MGYKIKKTTTHSPAETIDMAVSLAGYLQAGDVIALEGDLGAGKTVFVKGLAKGLEVEDYLHVNSPTFVILKEYTGKICLYHFDVYRLDERSFEETIDYQKYFYGEGLAVVEWSGKIGGLLPEEYLSVKLYHSGETERNITISGIGARFETIVNNLDV